MSTKLVKSRPLKSTAFSLIEVVLAMSIFLVTVLTLVGLMGPALKSVSDVKQSDEVISVVDSVNAFLKTSEAIGADRTTRFNEIYDAVQSEDHATILMFRTRKTGVITLKSGFVGETPATVTADDISSGNDIWAVSKIYRVVLTPSSLVPTDYHHSTEVVASVTIPERDSSTDTYKLKPNFSNVSDFNESVFPMEVRIYAEDPQFDFPVDSVLGTLKNEVPIFAYDVAIHK